jgi:hypothetical protein
MDEVYRLGWRGMLGSWLARYGGLKLAHPSWVPAVPRQRFTSARTGPQQEWASAARLVTAGLA